MRGFYSNIILTGPPASEVAAYLKQQGVVAWISGAPKGATVVFHEDLQSQEGLASALSAKFACPALLIMAYADSILLYHLYQNGKQIDAYVSSPHVELELDAPAPPGDASILCAAFEAERFERRIESILRKEAKPDQPYALAVNRHGELLRALGLPLFAAGAGFASIEMGETPAGNGFDAGTLIRTP